MVDYDELLGVLSRPRPNGSAALEDTQRHLKAWLERRCIPYRTHTYWLYPYFFECTGLWVMATRLLLAAAFLLRWGWPALLIALLSLPGGLVDFLFGIPLVTWPGVRQGENLLVTFEPQGPAQGELLFSAHCDSKTELLDHHQRLFFLTRLRLGILLTVFTGLLAPIDLYLYEKGSPGAPITYLLGAALCLGMLALSLGLGLNWTAGRLRPPSQGAVDNGAACTVLLGLAERLAAGEPHLQHTRVTLAIFSGEEVNMQGSRAYARSREWPLPIACLNLEIMAQNGPYVVWERDGTAFKLLPTHPDLSQAVSEAVAAVTGDRPLPGGPLTSDSGSFLLAGLPAAALGTYDRRLGDRGFHSRLDNLGRVQKERIGEGVAILQYFIQIFDAKRDFWEESKWERTAL